MRSLRISAAVGAIPPVPFFAKNLKKKTYGGINKIPNESPQQHMSGMLPEDCLVFGNSTNLETASNNLTALFTWDFSGQLYTWHTTVTSGYFGNRAAPFLRIHAEAFVGQTRNRGPRHCLPAKTLHSAATTVKAQAWGLNVSSC